MGYLYFKHRNISWLARIILFIVVFNIIELINGIIAKKIICKHIDTCLYGDRMWNYNNTPNIAGHIDILHTIYWVIGGIVGYLLYPILINIPGCKILIIFIIIWLAITITKFPRVPSTKEPTNKY